MYLNRVRQFLMLSVMVITFPLQANEFTGHWRGELSLPQGQSIEMVFHLKQGDDGLQGVVDVPAQKQFGLVFNSVEVAAKHITLKLDLAGIVYQGELNADQIIGHYQQGSFAAPLNLIRLASSDAEALGQRTALPQEPTTDLPYEQLDVSFVNNAQRISLSGILSIPKGPIKAAVILLSGSGPTTKDADAFGHKLFLVLADLLTRRGLAVLRYDDRGVGGSSGDYGSATTADFAQDALAAQAFLQQHIRFKHRKIGFIGHSEGGLIGAIAAANNPDIDFLVSLAGPGTSGAQILIDQSYYIQKLRGVSATELTASDLAQREIMQAISDDAEAKSLLALLLKHGMTQEQANTQLSQLTSPWFRFFVKAQPADYLANVTAPILALNGELDSQVLADANLNGILQATNHRATIKKLAGLNHLFQPALTGLPSEYSESDITFSESSADEISQWIVSLK